MTGGRYFVPWLSTLAVYPGRSTWESFLGSGIGSTIRYVAALDLAVNIAGKRARVVHIFVNSHNSLLDTKSKE